MATTNNNNPVDYATQNDRLHILIQEALKQVDSYEDKIRNIDTSLQNAKASLQNVPGVQSAIAAIDQSIQDNYNRGGDLQQVRQYEAEFFQVIGNAYMKFNQAVSDLKQPESNTNQQLQIENNAPQNQSNNNAN